MARTPRKGGAGETVSLIIQEREKTQEVDQKARRWQALGFISEGRNQRCHRRKLTVWRLN